MTASQSIPEATNSFNTNHFAQKPAKGGIPARDNIKIKNIKDAAGLVSDNPLKRVIFSSELFGLTTNNKAANAPIPIIE